MCYLYYCRICVLNYAKNLNVYIPIPRESMHDKLFPRFSDFHDLRSRIKFIVVFAPQRGKFRPVCNGWNFGNVPESLSRAHFIANDSINLTRRYESSLANMLYKKTKEKEKKEKRRDVCCITCWHGKSRLSQTE